MLENSVRNLHPSDFDENDNTYDAGQYQYYIDENFEPKQSPGKAQFKSKNQKVFLFLTKIPIFDALLRSSFGLIRKNDKL